MLTLADTVKDLASFKISTSSSKSRPNLSLIVLTITSVSDSASKSKAGETPENTLPKSKRVYNTVLLPMYPLAGFAFKTTTVLSPFWFSSVTRGSEISTLVSSKTGLIVLSKSMNLVNELIYIHPY